MKKWNRHFYLLCFLSFSSIEFIAAQDQNDAIIEAGTRLYELGETLFETDRNKSLIAFQKAYHLFRQSGQEDKSIEVANWMAYIHFSTQQRDSMRLILDDVRILVDSLEGLKQFPEYLIVYWNLNARYFSAKGAYRKQLRCDKKALLASENQVELDSLALMILYQNLAASYAEERDHYSAIYYGKKARSMFVGNSDSPPLVRENILYTLAMQYFRTGDFDKANALFLEAEKLLKKIESSDVEGMEVYIGFLASRSVFFQHQKQFNLAERDLFLAQKILKYNDSYSVDLEPLILKTLGNNFAYKNKKKEALQLLQQALALCRNNFGLKNHFTANTLFALGDFYKENPNEALSHYQKALTALTFEFNDSTNFAQNPTLDQTSYSKTRLLEILLAKAKTLQQINNPEAALSTYQLAIDLLDDIRRNHLADESKLFLQENAIPLFENAITVALQLDKKETAWQFAGKSKAVLLLENITDTRAKIFSNIDAALLEKEHELKMETGFLERKLYQAQQENDSSQITLYGSQLFDAKRTYEKLQDSLEVKYPRYHELKYEKQDASLANIQQRLRQDEMLVEYFFGQEKIFCFAITGDEMKVNVVENANDVADSVAEFRQQLVQSSTDVENFERYTDKAYGLYQKLLEPALLSFDNKIKTLKIVPDGVLGYIPFQALIAKPLTGEVRYARYDTLSYLMKTYHIYYDYTTSRSPMLEASREAIFTTDFIGFAPVFEGDAGSRRDGVELDSLLHNLKEVTQIDSIIGGVVYTDTMATTIRFRDSLSSHKILHLSTHAVLDDAAPMQSKIYFDDDFFTLGEIYGLPAMQTELVVLSACNTGGGALRRGEGIMSLARAFMYAGCPSLLTSLWNVDDESTAGIMVAFYENLHEGKRRDEALCLAQKNYLNEQDFSEYAHPYYWAGFVCVGEMEGVFEGETDWCCYGKILFGLLVSFLLLWSMKFYKKSIVKYH